MLLQLLPNVVATNATTKMCCSFRLVILFTGYTICVAENDAPAKATYLKLPVVDRKVHITTFTQTFSSGSPALSLVSVSDQLNIIHVTCIINDECCCFSWRHVPISAIFFGSCSSHLAQETRESLEAKVEMISCIVAVSLSLIETLLKMPGKVAGHLKKKIISQLGTLQKILVSELANIRDAIQSFFTSKRSSSYGGDGYAAIQEHFGELWGAISRLGMLELTTKAYSKGLITTEVKETIFSVNGTSKGIKADLLLSAIQERIRADQSAFDTFVEILRSEPAYEHLADKLTS